MIKRKTRKRQLNDNTYTYIYIHIRICMYVPRIYIERERKTEIDVLKIQ